MKTNYPKEWYEVEEQKRYKIRLAQHAENAGYDSVDDYAEESRKRYVLLSNADQPEHWYNDDLIPNDKEEDETDWCVYDSREEAERERQMLIKEEDYGHRVVTERYFLKMKGLI